MVRYLLEFVVVYAHRFVDPRVSIRLVGDVSEQPFEGWSRCVSFASKNVLIQRCVEKPWPHPFRERITSEKRAGSQILPHIDAAASLNETLVGLDRPRTSAVELRQDPVDCQKAGGRNLS